MPEDLVAPAHLWIPPHVSTAGPEVADFASSIGMIPDAEQRLVLDAVYVERADGLWAAFEAAVVASRQNMKTWAFQVCALADLFLFDANLVIWTAHLFPTAVEAFRDIKVIIERNASLSRRVKKITEANGEEGIELASGQRLQFKARSKSGGRGLTGDTVILDESFALGPSEMGSLIPTLSARPNPHVLYGSSAGKADSDMLRSVRDRGRAGGDPSLAYLEWCAPVVPCASDRCEHALDDPGCALNDREAWRKANPAMGRRIREDHIAAERRLFVAAPEEFARERLGWWDEPQKVSTGLPAGLWSSRALDADLAAVTVDALGVDVRWPDGGRASVSAVGHLESGELVAVLLDTRPGTDWVAGFVAQSDLPVALDMKRSSVVADDLGDLDITPIVVSSVELAQACGDFVEDLVRGDLHHLDQPELSAAVDGASRRAVGDAWAWDRKGSAADISPLVAATLAKWASRFAVSLPLAAWR